MCCENTLKQYSPFSPFPPLYLCHELDFLIYVTYIQCHWFYFCFLKTIKIRKIVLCNCHLFLFSYFPFFLCPGTHFYLVSYFYLNNYFLKSLVIQILAMNFLSLSFTFLLRSFWILFYYFLRQFCPVEIFPLIVLILFSTKDVTPLPFGFYGLFHE